MRVRLQGVAGFLPDLDGAESLLLTRAWLAVQEAARSDELIAVVVPGLRGRICAHRDRMPIDRALRLLEAHLSPPVRGVPPAA